MVYRDPRAGHVRSGGYMVAPSSLKLSVQICAHGVTGPSKVEIQVPLSKGRQTDKTDHRQKTGPCAFSALSMASMAGDHNPLLIAALATIVATIVTNGAPHLQHQTRHLRPPLRGLPSFANIPDARSSFNTLQTCRLFTCRLG